MFSKVSRRIFLPFLMILVLLNACTGQSNYAPVVSDNRKLTEDRQSPRLDNRNLNKINQNTSRRNSTFTEALKKIHRIHNRGFVDSVGLSSGYGYQRMVLENYSAPVHKIVTMERVKFSNTTRAGQLTYVEQSVTEKVKIDSPKKIEDSLVYKTSPEDKKTQLHYAVFKKAGNRKKKSIISIDNKNILGLNFGWPIKGRVLKSYSPGYNKGIDIAGKPGQSVNAAEAGEVVYCGQGLIGLGQLLIIKHNKAYLSAYANNRRVLVKEGQQVEKGQAIAEVGKIGFKKRASLHFEIRKNGSPVNPLKLLPKKIIRPSGFD